VAESRTLESNASPETQMRAIAVGVFGLLALHGAYAAERQEAGHRTWNLSKDIAGTGNQISFSQGARGVWYFMESSSLAHSPLIYRFLGEFNAPARPATEIVIPDGFSCWQNPATVVPDVCFNFNATPVTLEGFEVPPGTVDMHPDADGFAIVAWKSPLNGTVAVRGAVGDLHDACGNGVLWSIDRGGETLQSGDLPNGEAQTFDLARVGVRRGDVLYFVVDPKDGDHVCDSTSLDLTIMAVGKRR
jgi:hypothetical protein